MGISQETCQCGLYLKSSRNGALKANANRHNFIWFRFSERLFVEPELSTDVACCVMAVAPSK